MKLEKIKAEIEYLKLKNRYLETFGSPLSNAATRILKPQIVTTPQATQITRSPYDAKNNIIQCVECSQLFRWENKDEFLKQKFEFELHMTNNHNRPLSYLEKSVLDDLRYSGGSLWFVVIVIKSLLTMKKLSAQTKAGLNEFSIQIVFSRR